MLILYTVTKQSHKRNLLDCSKIGAWSNPDTNWRMFAPVGLCFFYDAGVVWEIVVMGIELA